VRISSTTPSTWPIHSVTNFQAAESTIRDAYLATESANLTKAQILLQAGVGALAQANSVPQQVLSLLKG
jgi:flagellin